MKKIKIVKVISRFTNLVSYTLDGQTIAREEDGVIREELTDEVVTLAQLEKKIMRAEEE